MLSQCGLARAASGEQSVDMLSARKQIAAMRAVARAALEEYELPDGALSFVAHGENTTFRHDSRAGRYLVRVHRPQRHGRTGDPAPAIDSEFAWLGAIRRDIDLEVPEPLLSREGFSSVTAAGGGETRTCSILQWMSGRIHENSARPVHLRRIGAALAALHDHADAWNPPADFTRLRWDHEAFFGDAMIYGGVPSRECWSLLPRELRKRVARVSDRLAPIMAAASDIGMIHADLHPGNAVFEGGRVKVIDFDDCGTGPRVYDLAVALWEFRDRPHYSEYLREVCAGYEEARSLDLSALDDFIAARQVSFCLWYTGTAEVNPAFAARREIVHDWSSEMLDLLGYG